MPALFVIAKVWIVAEFTEGTRPASILLTHLHPDHIGSALELANMWNVPVYVHLGDLPLASATTGVP
jgi:glyoxylase-like metal-dependent hydrolase (beta-lactamase superfamily II)